MIIKELKGWFKAYIVVALLVIPTLCWILTPLNLISEGSLTAQDMVEPFVHAEVTALLVSLVFMFIVICKGVCKKFKKEKNK